MTYSILIEDGLITQRIVVRDANAPVALYEFPLYKDQKLPGSHYDGLVVRLDHSLEAAFVSFAEGGEGFLPLRKNIHLTEGARVTCRIRRMAEAQKLPLLEIVEGDLPEEHPTQRKKIIAYLQMAYPGATIKSVDKRSAELLEGLFQQALARKVPLRDGAAYVFDEAEALTAIDFNLGGGQGQSKKGAIIKAVKASLPVLAEQILCRRIGGQIVVDFPKETYSARTEMINFLSARLKKGSKVGPFLSTGLLHLTVPKTMPSLLAGLSEPGAEALRPGLRVHSLYAFAAAMRAAENLLTADRLAHYRLHLAPDLTRESEAQMDWKIALEEKYGKRLEIISAHGKEDKRWELELMRHE